MADVSAGMLQKEQIRLQTMEVRTMFSYEDYKEIIRIIQSTGNQAGYEEELMAD